MQKLEFSRVMVTGEQGVHVLQENQDDAHPLGFWEPVDNLPFVLEVESTTVFLVKRLGRRDEELSVSALPETVEVALKGGKRHEDVKKMKPGTSPVVPGKLEMAGLLFQGFYGFRETNVEEDQLWQLGLP